MHSNMILQLAAALGRLEETARSTSGVEICRTAITVRYRTMRSHRRFGASWDWPSGARYAHTKDGCTIIPLASA
jgi:hypothetical protein